MHTITLARNAMATRFEIILHGDDPPALRAAGEEALEEIARLENRLSLYRPQSEIAQLNARAAREAVRVTPELFALLRHAQRLCAETEDAFDITIAPLVRCWGFMHNAGRPPTEAELAAARAAVGMAHVQLDAANQTVRFARDGVMLDLGAIGKGYAVERATEILRENGVRSGLIHGGTSTVSAIGHPPDATAWQIAVDIGAELGRRAPQESESPHSARSNTPSPVTIVLCDESVSVSAASGRQFEFEGKWFGHVIDPRTGRPTEAALLAAVVLPSATETDALSTALLTRGDAGHAAIAALRPAMRTLLVTQAQGGLQVQSRGFSPRTVGD